MSGEAHVAEVIALLQRVGRRHAPAALASSLAPKTWY
jgi:hypothetical protein